MEIQQQFSNVKEFLIQNKSRDFAEELLAVLDHSTIDFHPAESPMLKHHLIEVYSRRQQLENSRGEQFVKGYNEVLSNLHDAQEPELIITSIHSDHGAYIIFSDSSMNHLIGILKSSRTLSETREKYQLHPESNQYRKENLFINGKPS